MRALILALVWSLLLTLAPAAPLAAQSRAGVPAVSAARILDRPVRQPRRHRTQDVLVTAGIGLFVASYLGGAAVHALTSFAYFESAAPCVPVFCGHEPLFAVSLIPNVGSAIWSVMVLDTPPVPAGPGLAASGFVFTFAQQMGIGLLIAGLVGTPIPVAPSASISADGVRLGLSGTF